MEDIRVFLENYDVIDDFTLAEPLVKNKSLFKQRILEDFDKLLAIKDKHKGCKTIIMGLGPSLLDIDKNAYRDAIKITCNDFHKVPNFFSDNFIPDFWCAANCLKDISDALSICLKNDITCFLTLTRNAELEIVHNDMKEYSPNIITWLWNEKIFQNLIKQKYAIATTYSHCNTIVNHMLAFAMWIGSSCIDIAGFDLSYHKSYENTGMTHAGFNLRDTLSNDSRGIFALDDLVERKKIINDLQYLCMIAYNNNIKVNNLSYKVNKLPYNLSYEK